MRTAVLAQPTAARTAPDRPTAVDPDQVFAPDRAFVPDQAFAHDSAFAPDSAFEPDSAFAPEPEPADEPEPGPVAAYEPPAPDSTEVYRAVQASAAFQEIRRSYRAFVLPTSCAFLCWFLVYVAAQAAAPVAMRSEVAGPINVAWLLGLLQFASTFLLAWLYARNARTKRDRAALGLRWDTQDQLR
ncbi:DUF485 domain-containing protein [Streptomyces sp. FH025]|nr:DUF485 domain-containing protein [Streptomyces sp. FH025]